MVSLPFSAQHRHGAAAEAGHRGDDREVVAKRAVAGQRRELVEQVAGIVGEMWAAGVASHLDFLPRGQLGIGVLDQAVGPRLESPDLGVDLHRRVFLGELAQLDDLAFQLGDGTFEFQASVHGDSGFSDWVDILFQMAFSRSQTRGWAVLHR